MARACLSLAGPAPLPPTVLLYYIEHRWVHFCKTVSIDVRIQRGKGGCSFGLGNCRGTDRWAMVRLLRDIVLRCGIIRVNREA